MRYREVVLERDCEAVAIPSGDRSTIPAGSRVVITQQLGDSFTIQAPEIGGLYRIAGDDADALGMPRPVPATESDAAGAGGPVSEEALWAQLRNVYDPEIPVNIVDLGLVYGLRVEPLEGGGSRVHLVMTLTAPGCGLADVIAADARRCVERVPGVKEAYVDIVFDPPWNYAMMSEVAKLELGFD